MEFTIQTPTLLFSAISLLMLAYTNRFVVIANLIRELYTAHMANPSEVTANQLKNLRKRMRIIRNMQVYGAFSFFFSVLSLLFIFLQSVLIAEIIFGFSLVALLISLVLLIMELNISVHALNIQLKDFKD
jgi:type VI protein secretion system component VasF